LTYTIVPRGRGDVNFEQGIKFVPKLEKSPKIFHKNRVVFYAILEKTPKIKE
jgi:hypothetical protein